MFAKQNSKEVRYKNREIDWLRFNHRVLQEASDLRNPLFERLKFLAIFSSNLDEFFRVRVSKLRQLKKVEKKVRKPLGLKPNKLLKEIIFQVHLQQEEFGAIFQKQILPELRSQGISFVGINGYSEAQKSELRNYFDSQISKGLTILTGEEFDIDAFKEGRQYVAIFKKGSSSDLSFVEVPSEKFGRFIEIPSSDNSTYCYTYLEDIVKLNLDQIFPDDKIQQVANIKISKDAELYLDDEYEGDWVEQIYASLKKRKVGQPTRFLYEQNTDAGFLKAIRKRLNLGKVDMMQGGERHNFSDFMAFSDPTDNPQFHFEPMPPLKHNDFESSLNFFDLISARDCLLHFPYQDFHYVEQWLEEAAMDAEVVSIHISLYRIAEESKLTTALLKALQNGKAVNIFVEAKARFDEANNINWGRKFEENGGKVFYSFPNIKVHSKILLIQRRNSEGKLKGYAYIGTGNFNAQTAKIYCDHALFTADKKLIRDLEQVFRVLKRELLLPKLKKLIISPFNARIAFEKLIQREIDNAKNGLPACIIAKMNSLEDRRMIDWLYQASNAGVHIKLIVRGFCCLIPQVKGQSENINVISIVDRFLEHARVFLFHNNGKEEMFMGSADWMTRNLDKRIEVITPILDKAAFLELKQILDFQIEDNFKARIVDENSSNMYVPHDNKIPVRSQYAIYEYLKDKHGTPHE
ncbi:polyphosphate kinase 1 [Costertonia aggregata]|uniref:Polyphosphate kinase n=1 Tax=Costertonia aggregata TaxID=343403 RepID=A0A7H9ATP2_9FLAO|nr:polyphosphate kinase 1 [Costertonia aggregata]QLG46565.1 polyphosphate kinase 1 [Costertonia aggregata]